MKKIIEKIWNKRIIILSIVPFVMMDILLKILFFRNRVFQIWWPSSWLFSAIWIMLFGVIIFACKGRIRIIVYWIIFAFFFIFTVTNVVYYSKTELFFNLNLIKMADEGSEYIWDTIIHTNILLYIALLVILVIAFFVSKKIQVVKQLKWKAAVVLAVIFIVIHLLIPPVILGKPGNTATSRRNVYIHCSDPNQSLELCGLYEYTTRMIYTSFFDSKDSLSSKEKNKLDKIYGKYKKSSKNDYTGIFKGKNVIFLQLEGLDDWTLNKKDTPNLYKLKSKSIDFSNFYSMYVGAGSTFNAEISANTGFVQPLSSNYYACWYYYNHYKYTMPSLFKKIGYDVNSFHMNSKDFYYRELNYKDWKYDNYYGLKDIKEYKNNLCKLDRELILNKNFKDKIFNHKNKKFVDYIITYTPHMPWSLDNEAFKYLSKEKKYEGKRSFSEEELVRMAVGETDYMVKLLIDELKKRNLYDNTVIVAYADHYLYTLNDKRILDKNKNTDKNFINHTPCFIWSSDIKKTIIKKPTMQTNILPTVLNLFGIEYDANYFVGEDALDKKYDGLIFFPDYSWYDGKTYVKKDEIIMGDKIDKKELEEKSKKVSDMIYKNDYTLIYDYFDKEKNKER